jgi:hypothetical protein
MTDETPPQNPLTRVVRAAQAYRRSKSDAPQLRSPANPQLWMEVCDALDALALSGTEAEIAKLEGR